MCEYSGATLRPLLPIPGAARRAASLESLSLALSWISEQVAASALLRVAAPICPANRHCGLRRAFQRRLYQTQGHSAALRTSPGTESAARTFCGAPQSAAVRRAWD